MHTHHLIFYFTTHSLGKITQKCLFSFFTSTQNNHYILFSDKCKIFFEQAKEKKYF